MKRWICLLLGMAMLASGTASAQEYYTLPEIRGQAAAGWHETYTDKYGRETVVDIDVEVFGEDVAPVIRIANAYYEPDFDILEEGENAEKVEENGRFSISKNHPYNSISGKNRKDGRRTDIYTSYGEEVEFDRAYLADYENDLTVSEAYEFIQGYLEKHGLNPDEFHYEYPKEFYAICSISQSKKTPVTPGFYLMTLSQKFYDLPVLTHAMYSFENMGWPYYTPEFMIQIRNQNEYSFNIEAMKEVEMFAEDIPLCSFDKVIETIEKQIEAGKIQQVFSLQFGYTLYNKPGLKLPRGTSWNEADYYSVPSWVVKCAYLPNGKKTLSDEVNALLKKWGSDMTEEDALDQLTNFITINAQTGEMLDPMNTSKAKTNNSPNGTGDADYKGFISWEDVK